MDVRLEDSMPAYIKTILLHLIQEGIIGLSCMKKIRVTTNNNNGSNANIYSYVLEIPYAGTYLTWEVVFSNEDTRFAPDFNFINDQFLTDPDINVIEKDLPSLQKWNINDSACLYNVVKEILNLYKKFQVDKLQVNKYNRQFAEYNMLIDVMQITEQNIEVLIDQSDCVHFLILLPIDVSVLPPYMGKYFETGQVLNNPGKASITVRVSYMNANKVQTVVWLSPQLQEVIGTNTQLQIPTYSKDIGLLEYLPAVEKIVQEQLHLISIEYKLRNEFISTMLAYQKNSIIEYDNITFNKITMLLEAHNNHCLVVIELGKNIDHPIVVLRSLHCDQNSKPLGELLQYPTIKNLSVEEMVKLILKAIYIFLSNYKNVDFNNSHNETRSYAAVVK